MPECYRVSPEWFEKNGQPEKWDGPEGRAPVSVDQRERGVTWEQRCTGEYLREDK